MFAHHLESFLVQISAPFITELFIYAIAIIFILAIGLSLFKVMGRFTQYAPPLMTSLGILGTFIGIVIGLLGFDTTNIDGSIPALLEGLKTAFITSIFGLVGAISFNFIDSMILQNLGRKKNEVAVKTITPDDIYTILKTQYESMRATQGGIEKLYLGITGQEEGSLVGQFKMLRADPSGVQKQTAFMAKLIVDFREFATHQKTHQAAFEEKLFKELANFAEMLSKSATEQIIEALKTVIEDFNTNLTEQFGENFKALDASVKKLVLWQAEYRLQVELMSERYAESVTSLMETQTAVSGISKECEVIPAAMDQLREVVEVNQHQIAELQRHLEAFVAMRDAAVEAVPTIQGEIDKVGTQLAEASDTMKERLLGISEKLLEGSSEMQVALEEGSQHFRDSVTVTQQSFNELTNTIKNSSESLSETLQDTSAELTNHSSAMLSDMKEAAVSMQQEVAESVSLLQEKTSSVGQTLSSVLREFESSCQSIVEESERKSHALAQSLNEHLTRSTDTHEQHMNYAVEKTGKVINAELEQLEKATAREIQKAMQEMGDSLVKITSRFVNDYEKMVTSMEQVISSSRRY